MPSMDITSTGYLDKLSGQWVSKMVLDRSPPLTKHAQHGHYKHRLLGQVVWTMGVKDPRSRQVEAGFLTIDLLIDYRNYGMYEHLDSFSICWYCFTLSFISLGLYTQITIGLYEHLDSFSIS
ncbi:hypothetical protein RRG08_014525 [Elysia crispata]|uniref:Uncharacterized protein n=1 Tax=Elysia crispata TaxID=231223 RepID=A0AAE1AXS4_9GAST|nr:hypothetical protein RRG08_014525 [Elysia crispata]